MLVGAGREVRTHQRRTGPSSGRSEFPPPRLLLSHTVVARVACVPGEYDRQPPRVAYPRGVA